MFRKITLTKKNGNRFYVCSGNNCKRCKLRFLCLTTKLDDFLVLDWLEIRDTHSSPTKILNKLTNGKIYVRGSRKYNKIVDKDVNYTVKYL